MSLQKFSFLIGGAALLFSLAACSESDDTDQAPTDAEGATPIAAYEVAPRDISRRVTLSATVEPRHWITLRSRTAGIVSEVLVEESDGVAEGDLLARFDLAEQRAELERARARTREARAEMERFQQLRDTETISLSEIEAAEAAYEIAVAEQDLWETRIEFGEINAPRSGIITSRSIEPGESVEPQEPLFELADMSELVLRPGVSERDIRHLATGQPVTVQLDGLPDEHFAGSIRRIFPAAERSSRLVEIEVLLPGDAYERGVRPGFLGRMPLVVDARPEAIAVPAAAVGEDGDQRYIYKVVDERLTYQEIETGITRGQWTEVLSGIEQGDIVLATNPIDMADGALVRIVNWRG